MRPDVAQAALGRWPSILAQLGVKESFLKDRHGPCPVCGGSDRYRFDDKEGKGTWYCNNCGAGDGFTLLMRLKSIDFKVAADLVREILPSAQTKIEKPKRGGEREALRNLWKGSVNVTVGDEVFRYLSNRRVLADPPSDLRFCPSAGYFEDGKKVGTYPAMLALVRDASGKPVTIHRTYLQDGKKAPVQSPKKLVSPIGAGACIRLFQASKAVCVTEGIETALAVRKVTGEPVWAAISAGGLKGWICPPDIKHVCIYADNDLNFVGQEAGYALARRLVREGKAVQVFVPEIDGTDWADQ